MKEANIPMASRNLASTTETIEKNPALRRKMNRFGMSVFILSQLVPLVVLIDMRYLFVGTYVSSRESQPIALIAAVLMLASLFVTWSVKTRAAHKENRTPALKWALLLGVAALLVTFYQWSLRTSPTTGRFGEVYYTMTGFAVFYAIVGIVGLLSALSRARYVDSASDDHWHVEAVSFLWSGIAVIWVVTYIVLFWV